MACWM